jgi:NAD(P)-dependent dehydrogenase (short-subunit alcohol dehydrogenase family)
MRDTLRRKSGKSVDLDSGGTDQSNLYTPSAAASTHQRSISNASVIAGGAGEKSPWNGMDIPTTSNRDQRLDTADTRGRQNNLELPSSQRSERSVSEKPTRRRKKTLNQINPHRFELVDAKRDSISRPVPAGERSHVLSEEIFVTKTRSASDKANNESDVVDGTSLTKKPSAESKQPTPSSFSPVRSIVDIPQTQPREQPRSFSGVRVVASTAPIEPPSPPTPPESTPTSPKRNFDFSSSLLSLDFDNTSRQHESTFLASPTSAVPNGKHDSSGSPTSAQEPHHYTPPRDPLPPGSLLNKVVVLTNGTSLISQPLLRSLHAAGARVVFSVPPSQSDKARSLIRTLGPPDTLHFNATDLARHSSIHALFALAHTMYGRVDHAIFSPGDDGGHALGIGAGEALWGLDVGRTAGRSMTAKAELSLVADKPSEVIDQDGVTASDVVACSARFARVALAYLRNSPGRHQTHGSASASDSATSFLTPTSATTSSSGTSGFSNATWDADRSLTFISSTAALVPTAHLPIYTAAQHATLGIARSLSQSVDVRRDGVRINLIATNMLLPSVIEGSGSGRMSVRLPSERGEDVAAIVAGVLSRAPNGQNKALMHGRVLYALGAEAVDVQDGLDANMVAWMGAKGSEAYARANGIDLPDQPPDTAGRKSTADSTASTARWMLLDSPDSAF